MPHVETELIQTVVLFQENRRRQWKTDHQMCQQTSGIKGPQKQLQVSLWRVTRPFILELSGGSNSCETKRGLQEEVLVKILSKTCTVTPQDKAKVCASHPP